MPLWTCHTRRLACKYHRVPTFPFPPLSRCKLPLPQPHSSYRTVSSQSQHDDTYVESKKVSYQESSIQQGRRSGTKGGPDGFEQAWEERDGTPISFRKIISQAARPIHQSQSDVAEGRSNGAEHDRNNGDRASSDLGKEDGEQFTHPDLTIKSYDQAQHMSNLSWRAAFAHVWGSRIDGYASAGHVCDAIFAPKVIEWVDSYFDERQTNTLSTFRPSYAGEQPHVVWSQIALWLLVHDVKEVLPFLLATHEEPYPPPQSVSDCMQHIANVLLHSKGSGKQWRDLAKAVCTLSTREDRTHLPFPSHTVRLLLLHCPVRFCLHIYRAITDGNIFVKHWTYYHFVAYFAKHGYYNEAVDALRRSIAAGGSNYFRIRTVCSTLLRKSIEQPDGLRETLRLVSLLSEWNVKLDVDMCNIIMLNAVEARDLKTAFDVYYSLIQHGLRPTERTFTALLKACKTNIDDIQMLNEVIRDAISHVNVRQSSLVADNILHCLALHHSKHHPETALQTLTEAHAQFFDLVPLRTLGLPLPEVPPIRLTTEALMPPSRWALYFLIGASLNHILRHGPNDARIHAIYKAWRARVEVGDPVLAPLATRDYVSNLFLSAFTRTQAGLIHAANVLRDMQRPITSSTAGNSSAAYQQCPPSVISFNILLHGFTKHKQTAAAERLVVYMRETGVRPDIWTWNTLLAEYARVGDVDQALGVLERGKEEGVEWNAATKSVKMQASPSALERWAKARAKYLEPQRRPIEASALNEIGNAADTESEDTDDSPTKRAEQDWGYRPFE